MRPRVRPVFLSLLTLLPLEYSRNEVLTLSLLAVSLAAGHGNEKLVVGLVGYPNVGKSSTINALIGEKKVSVSATPGKTKHFQTIRLSQDVLLCDCPGLVFPQFASTKAELVCNGVLPIDQLREFTGPVELVTRRIPQQVLEGTYGLRINVLPENEGGTGYPTAAEFLTTFSSASLAFLLTFSHALHASTPFQSLTHGPPLSPPRSRSRFLHRRCR